MITLSFGFVYLWPIGYGVKFDAWDCKLRTVIRGPKRYKLNRLYLFYTQFISVNSWFELPLAKFLVAHPGRVKYKVTQYTMT